jgi:hypothetical protein
MIFGLLGLGFGLAPVLGYVPQGPGTSDDDVSSYSSYLASLTSQPDDDGGVQSGNYAADKSGLAHSTYDSVSDYGPIAGNYDPELSAWLTTEGV